MKDTCQGSTHELFVALFLFVSRDHIRKTALTDTHSAEQPSSLYSVAQEFTLTQDRSAAHPSVFSARTSNAHCARPINARRLRPSPKRKRPSSPSHACAGRNFPKGKTVYRPERLTLTWPIVVVVDDDESRYFSSGPTRAGLMHVRDR